MADSPSEKITLGQYMWERLHQVGVDTIFGVPGSPPEAAVVQSV